MLRNFFKRTLLLAVVGAAASLHGHAAAQCGDSNFNYASYSAGPAKSEQTPEAKVLAVAGKFSQIAGKDGTRLLPEGTAIDAAELADGVLTVKITLPAGTTTLTQEQAYVSLDVLKTYFKEQDALHGIKLSVRTDGSSDYSSADDFISKSGRDGKGPRATPDNWYEPDGPGPQPAPDYDKWYAELRKQAAENKGKNFTGASSTGTSGAPFGPLTGINVFTYGGHGRTWRGALSTPIWDWQREFIQNMLEDFGNVDAVDFFAPYILNAGGTVIPFRPIGYQNNEVIVDNPAATFAGSWTDSVSTRFYGSGTPYRYSTTTATETATATYTPNIPAAGYYPVYTWVNYGSDRVPGQLYRIKTTGGETQIRVNHRRVGCGWVYLGTYYFAAGTNAATGSVVISNILPPSIPAGTPAGPYVAIADAIRFGNGMGDVNKGGGVSGYSRREESTVYWIQKEWGNGDAGNTDIWDSGNSYNDEAQSWNSPPEMAAYMNRLDNGSGDAYKYSIYLCFHSNSGDGTARGSEGLTTSSNTIHQQAWASMVSDEVDHDCLIEDDNWEDYPAHPWTNRSASYYDGGYGEISNYNFGGSAGSGGEMDATIIEIGFHDNTYDAHVLRDPKGRNVMGRAAYKAVVRYFNTYQAGLLAFLPEPPVRFRAKNNGTGGVTLNWVAPASGGAGGDAATGYRVYQSTDGLGFGQPVASATTSATVTGLTAGQVYYFRVTSTNAGGESLPSEVLAVKVRASGSSKVLIVNGYDRFDRSNDVDRGLSGGVVDQLITERNNSFNYVRQHGAALAAAGFSFDSTSNEAVANGDISLNSYEMVDWILGEESSKDKTFDSTERTAVTNFLNAGGKELFVSGAEIGYELDGLAVSPSFYNSTLMADYASDDGGSYQATGVAGTALAGLVMNFPASSTMYDASFPDTMTVSGGSTLAANYTGGGSGGAAVQFSGGSPARKVINLGFPFECINSTTTQNQVMAAAMTFFGVTEPSISGVLEWELY